MKNGSIVEKLKMQERELKTPIIAEIPAHNTEYSPKETVGTDSQLNSQTFSQPNDQPQLAEQPDISANILDTASSLFSILPSASDIDTNPNPNEEQFPRKPKKKKKQRRIS
jgi:hypothetical protein